MNPQIQSRKPVNEDVASDPPAPPRVSHPVNMRGKIAVACIILIVALAVCCLLSYFMPRFFPLEKILFGASIFVGVMLLIADMIFELRVEKDASGHWMIVRLRDNALTGVFHRFKKQRPRPAEHFRVQKIEFICEQDGDPEQEFKRNIMPVLSGEESVRSAYLARVSYGNIDELHVALCIESNRPDDMDLVRKIEETFFAQFGSREHLDIMFLDSDNLEQIKNRCRPFYEKGTSAFNIHGPAPYSVAVVHGGPGAAGEMAPVARRLANNFGILEPIQTAATIDGQVAELADILRNHAQPPAVLIGHSWGAWLSFIVAARYPDLVKKLVMVGSGPFEEKYAPGIRETRMSRLTQEEKTEYESILRSLATPSKDESSLLSRLGKLTLKADTYDLCGDENDIYANLNADIFRSVWDEAAELRRNGKLLALASRIQCPVIALHGDYDPHPAEGVEKPLQPMINDFRFVLLKHCGHTPWLERQAAESFYSTLIEILRQ